VATQIVFEGWDREHSSRGTLNRNSIDIQEADRQVSLTQVNVLKWNYDHFAAPLANSVTFLLDFASSQHPSFLKGFALDISKLSWQGLAVLPTCRTYYSDLDLSALKSSVPGSILP
jgi:hypothetical protein